MNRTPENVPLIVHRKEYRPSGRSYLDPMNAFAEKRLKELPLKTDLHITIRRRRSNPHNALYWSVLHKVIEASEKYATAEKLHKALLMALGMTTELITLDGKVLIIPDSTAFANMDQQAFGTYYSHAMELLARLLGTDPIALVKEGEAA